MTAGARICGWCRGPIGPRQRRDAVYCRTACRQAAHRFGRHRGAVDVAGEPMRFAYADPPYPTKAHLYRGHPDFAGEVDHAELIARLEAGSYHGWALSTSASALPAVLALCPPGVRVASWHRGERPTRSYGPLNAWEPVIYLGGRLLESELDDRRVDALAYTSRPRMTDPARVIGAKPAAFAYWMFRLLGARIGDTLDDIYPGSGGIARAWAHYQDPSALLEP